MDDKDFEILRLVQSNARLTADAIGHEIGLSSPAVQKRLKKLRETGVIEKELVTGDYTKWTLKAGVRGSGHLIVKKIQIEKMK